MLGVIAAGHAKTAQAGTEILQQGGNAVDAAVAASFASFIAEPSLVNIGGGGIGHVYNPATQQATVFDFFSAMPGLPAPTLQPGNGLDFRKISIDFGAAQQVFYIGRGSVAVHGVVAGLGAMVKEMGRLSLAQVLAPAIRMAREGIALAEMQAYIATLLAPILTDTPEIASIYAPNGSIVKAGQLVQFTALADTLEQLGQEGPALFYTGAVAAKIVVDQQKNGGLLTATDLSSYQVVHTTPITIPYRGYTILVPPLSSAGGGLIGFALKLLVSMPLSDLKHGSFEHIRTMAEVMRLTNIARTTWDAERKEQENVGPSEQVINLLLTEDTVRTYQDQLKQILAGQTAPTDPIQAKGPNDTTHISVADATGMMVGITTSAGENAGYVVADSGVMLNNMLGEIDLHPDGFHQLPPGQRLTTMMSPIMVLREGRPILTIGSGGSNRLRSAILQVISNIIDFKLPLQAAVDAPRIHFEDNALQLEYGNAPKIAHRLEQAGYVVNLWPERNMFFGGTHTVAAEGNGWTAAGDSRRGGAVSIVVVDS